MIRNNLQFTTGEQVSPVLIAETEAYLLNLGYINDTEINIEQIADTELVDVNIIVRDKWTLGVDIRKFDLSGSHIEVFQKNFLGRGNQIRANLLYNHDFTDRVGFGGSYLQRNISHTFIDMQGSYLDDINSRQLSASIKRDLQINLDYFGEIRYSRNQTRTNIAVWDSISPDFRESYSVSLGRAITLPSNYASKRIIFSASYKQKSPKYKDEVYQNHMKDKLLRYQDTENTMWLAQASFYKYAYVREYLLHNFGTAENIAEGYNVSLQGGYSLFKHLPDGMYASFKASYGSYHILNGNIYAEAAISSFFRRSEPYESVLKTEIRYFSPLFRLNSGRMRQFFTLNYTKLLTSNRYFSDQIYLDETNLRVDKGDGGLEQLLFKSESDLFSNIEIIGFRFLFYSFLDMGWLTPKNNLFNKDNFFWGIGAGIRLRNDLLVFNTIDLKIGLYPKNQSGFNRYFDIKSSTPNISPNFVSSYPEEFVLY